MMHQRSSFVLIAALSVIALGSFILSGCDNPSAATTGQGFGNVVWKPDGSGFYAYFDRFDATTIYTTQYALTNLNADGSFGSGISTSLSFVNPIYPPNIFLSSDGTKAITQLGENLYQLDMPSGNQTLLTTKVNVFLVSPDQKYAIVSPSPLSASTRTISVLNIAARPVYEVKKWDVADVRTSSGIWLKNGTFALTVNTDGGQIRIFDTLGTALDTISSALQVFHNGNYIPSSDILYFVNTAGNIDGYQLGTRTRTHLFSDETVTNFDFSVNGTLAAVVTPTGLYALNVESGAKQLVASDAFWGAFLSPDAKRVAYIHEQSSYFDVLSVKSISLP